MGIGQSVIAHSSIVNRQWLVTQSLAASIRGRNAGLARAMCHIRRALSFADKDLPRDKIA